MDVPENFNWPYLARSVRDFWQRWHITFSRALTAHLFFPIARNLSRRWSGHPAGVTAATYVVTFAFCGYWHGPTLNFVLWGLYHATGLIAVDWNQRRRRTRRLGAVSNHFVVRFVSIAGTFIFVSLGWILFALPVEALLRLDGM